jgi:hypothetical protein
MGASIADAFRKNKTIQANENDPAMSISTNIEVVAIVDPPYCKQKILINLRFGMGRRAGF